jgi:F0F1-type ATP synthase assembly protein I
MTNLQLCTTPKWTMIGFLLQGFVIPVNIRVTDANDNAPQFINAPYVLNISEVGMTNGG